MIELLKSRVTNLNFKSQMSSILGQEWKISETDTKWVLESNSTVLKSKYFDSLKRLEINSQECAKDLINAFNFAEDPKAHDAYIQNLNGEKIEIKEAVRFGLTAWFNARKSPFCFLPLNKFGKEQHEFLEECRKVFNGRQAYVYKKNALNLYALLAIRKFAYVPDSANGVGELTSDGFRGVLPDPTDFAAYLDPFLVFLPALVGVPIHRFASGIIFVPEKAFGFPYDGNVGMGDLLVSSPIGLMDVGAFGPFGGEDFISKIFINKFINLIINALNDYIYWLVDPATCLEKNGIYDASFGIQLLAGAHSVFISFIFLAKRVGGDERLWHSFNLLDKISNLSVNYSLFKGSLQKIDNETQYEATRFQVFFERKFFNNCCSMVRLNLNDKKLSDLIIQNETSAFDEVITSLKPLGKINESIRVIRNLSHGAFLRNERFLKTFVKGRTRVSSKLPALIYFYMFCFVLNPDKFLQMIAGYQIEN